MDGERALIIHYGPDQTRDIVGIIEQIGCRIIHESEIQRLAGQERFWKGVADTNAARADKISARHAEVQTAALDATRKCMAAWAAGEPAHRVKDMIDAVERLQSLVDPLHAKSEFDE